MDAANTLALQQTFERRQLPDSLTRAIMRLAAACTTAEQTIVLTRILDGLADALPAAQQATLVDAGGAPSGLAALLTLLADPDVQRHLEAAEPLAGARLNGIAYRRDLLAREGGVVSARELADLLGITPQAVAKRRQAGKLLAIADGQTRYAYPVWQVRDGETLPGLEAVLGELTNMSALDKAHFMTSPDARLEGQTPLDVLRSGDIARVRAAAHAYGTQGAA